VPRKKVLSDADVLSAAGRVFGRIGPARFTLADVAEEAGLAPATLVQRFGSKRALMLAFAEHAANLAREPFERARGRTAEPLGALRSALLLASRSTNGRRGLSHSLAFLQEDLVDEELRAHAARHARWTETSIRELLDSALERGELATSDTARLARALQAAWNGALIQWAIRGRGSLAAWISSVIDTLLEPHLVPAPPGVARGAAP
jgi:AcrR family transcriptional regulator